MTREDFPRFAEVVGGFAELKGKSLSGAAIRLYWRALEHWSLEDFQRAAEGLLRRCEFMPTPKDFEDLRKAAEPTAGEEWSAILMHARKGWKAPELSRQGAVALRAIGGIDAVRMSETSRTPFLERRFCEHFESMRGAIEHREVQHSGRLSLSGPRAASELLARVVPKR